VKKEIVQKNKNMFRIEVITSKNSRTQTISEDSLKNILSEKLIQMLRVKHLRSVALSKSPAVMYILTRQNDA